MSKYFIILFLTYLFSFSNNVLAAQCDDAYSAAADAYSYARRGYRSGNLDDIQRYARRAMNSADEAMSYASDCNCDDAYSAADDAYSYARKAYREDDFDYAESYIKKAMNSADDAMSYASDCN